MTKATYTAFCIEASGMGTTWIESFAINTDGLSSVELIDKIRVTAVEKCSRDWGMDEGDITCYCVIAGEVQPVFFSDEHTGGGF